MKTKKTKKAISIESIVFIIAAILGIALFANWVFNGSGSTEPISRSQINDEITAFYPNFFYLLRQKLGESECVSGLSPVLSFTEVNKLIVESQYHFSPYELATFVRDLQYQEFRAETTKDGDVLFYATGNPVFSFSCQIQRHLFSLIISFLLISAIVIYSFYLRFINYYLNQVDEIIGTHHGRCRITALRDHLFYQIPIPAIRLFLMSIILSRMEKDARYQITSQRDGDSFSEVVEFTQ